MKGARTFVAAVAVVTLLISASACGGDFVPPSFPATGAPAQPLGQVFDFDVSLPDLYVPEAGARGLEMDLRLDLASGGPGVVEATYLVKGATAAMGRVVEVEDLGTGMTTIALSADTFLTYRLGPFRIGTVSFEVLLRGVPAAGGRFVSGEALESQTTLPGTFSGWSRHRFIVATTDFGAAGRLSQVDLTGEAVLEVVQDLGQVSGDPFLRRTGEGIFVVNRLSFDNVQRLDPMAGFATAWQATTGVGSNPHDIVLDGSGRGFVTRFEPPFNDVAVISAADGSILGRIPLEALAENRDATPRADRIVAAAGALFVGLQDIDRTFSRYAEGKLAVIDPATLGILGMIPLGGKNPGVLSVVVDGNGKTRIYVALAGIFPGLLPRELSGGVVVVDADQRGVERVALDDDAAGGNIVSLAMVSAELGYVVVNDAQSLNHVLAFDPATGSILRTVHSSVDLIAEIKVDTGGVLAVPDRSASQPRVCLFRVPLEPAAAESPLGCAFLEQAPFSVEPLD
jgi:DNA-binding beta-propeller fold protein YncE